MSKTVIVRGYSLRYVIPSDIIQPEDDNNIVDAVRAMVEEARKQLDKVVELMSKLGM